MELYKRFLVVIAAIACAAAVVCGVIVAKNNTEKRLYGETRQQREVTDDLPLSFFFVFHQKIPYCLISPDRASAVENVLAASCRENKYPKMRAR